MCSITASNISFSYEAADAPRQYVFRDLSLQVAAHEVVAIVGPSGCGKTTLLNILAGFKTPTSGYVTLHTEGSIGYIFQQDALLPWRTVRRNLDLVSELKGCKKYTVDLFEKALRRFRLDTGILNRYPTELSGGMRQRICVIQALLAAPSVLLLDEPFGALDLNNKLVCERNVRDAVAETNMAALIVTHDIDEAIAMGDRVLVMGFSGIVDDIRIDIDRATISPEEAREHRSFGNYYSSIWKALRDAV